jgi:predicted PurR-regulated permease PerM
MDFRAVQERVSESMLSGSKWLGSRALTFGQGTFDFVVSFFLMLYLLFFLLRDGGALVHHLDRAIPLARDHREQLAAKFTTVIRATVKGNVVVALVQGVLGGLILWILGIQAPLLWGVLMALLSLLPAVGAAMVWVPIAVFLMLAGSAGKALVLVLFGVFVIGLVDNVLRPVLVGKDTQMPDYLVLVSTLGGIALFGINGFVIGPVIAALFIAVWDLFAASRVKPPG